LSSDIPVTVTVDSSEIDAALAKLDAALERKNTLTLPISNEKQEDIYFTSPELLDSPVESGGFNAFWGRLDMEIVDAKLRVDTTIAEGQAKLDMLKLQANTTAAQTKAVVAVEGPKIEGLERSSRRIIRMIPGLREADQLTRNMKLLSAGNIAGALGIALIAYQIYLQINRFLQEQERQKQEYRQTIMQVQNFTTKEEFYAWQRSQQQAFEAVRNRVIF
jgi:hypothetical protein